LSWWRKPEYAENTTDLLQVADKLYHTMLYQVHISMIGIQTQLSGGSRGIVELFRQSGIFCLSLYYFSYF
jgi:hypothetical protein